MMNFDINTVTTDMLSAMRGVFSDNWKKVEPVAIKFVQDNKNRLKLLSESYLNGEITQQKLASRLEDEKTILEAQLEALKVVSKALVQKAVNMAFNILSNAIKTTVKTVL